MHGRDDFDGFEFHDDGVLYDQVCPEPYLNPDAFVDHGNRLLANDAQSSLLQLVHQNRFVGGLQKSRPQSGMNAVRGVYDLRRYFVFGHVKSGEAA